jgi:hypothetical protein
VRLPGGRAAGRRRTTLSADLPLRCPRAHARGTAAFPGKASKPLPDRPISGILGRTPPMAPALVARIFVLPGAAVGCYATAETSCSSSRFVRRIMTERARTLSRRSWTAFMALMYATYGES